MRKLLENLSLFIIFIFLVSMTPPQGDDVINKQGKEGIKLVDYVMKDNRKDLKIVDHSKFDVLQKQFSDAHELTAACLSCHNGRATEIMTSSHYKWLRNEEFAGKGVFSLGKMNVLNNFCIGIGGSEAACTECHIGYGYEDKEFDFNEPNNIDCVVCHDQTGTYKKGKGGYPIIGVDLSYVAKNIGLPQRENCGVCHYLGGGGNNVKHGDLDIAMNDCSRDVDVHMTTEGENMSCVECHKTENHDIPGQLYAVSSTNEDRVTCTQCHTNTPHAGDNLNNHIKRIACQTCHIPIYAKANPTKMYWDWSTAGRFDEEGKKISEPDAYGGHKYFSIKGTFVYQKDVEPEYYWFNGTANHMLTQDKIESAPVQINSLNGSYSDKTSKIWPVKVHRGRQIYDSVNMTLIQPKLWDKLKGQGAYWTDFDWDKASEKGMEYTGYPYSGHYDFISTEMYWPLNHQVSPADKSLTCIDCHTRDNGRLADVGDFYLLGRDTNASVEFIGFGLAIASLLGVFVHALIRIFYKK